MRSIALFSMIALSISLQGNLAQAQTPDCTVPGTHLTIQGAIDDALECYYIEVSAGTYYESLTISRSLELRSTLPPVPENTIIDASGLGQSVVSVVGQGTGSVPDVTIQGFTITKGNGLNGGGVFCDDWSICRIEDSVITDNDAVQGGGVSFGRRSEIRRSKIYNNRASQYGGGLRVYYYGPTCINSWIYDNSATVAGGGVFVGNGVHFSMQHCTVADNVSGGGIAGYPYYADIVNSIVWDNEPYQFSDDYPDPFIVNYSDVEDGYPGNGNIDKKPMFVDSNNGNYHLRQNSKCKDAGIVSSVTDDIDGLNQRIDGSPDMGADEVN